MTGPRARDGWVVALALAAAALATAAVALRWRTLPPGADALRATAYALVVLAAIGVVGQRHRAARLAWLFVVPAALVGRLWQLGQPVTSAAFGWFAYAPLPGTARLVAGGGSPAPALTVGVLVLVLWGLTTVGLVTLLTDARPTGGWVRPLAVVAGVLTVPLWVPLTARTSLGGLPLSAAPVPPALDAVRVAGLVLVVAVGVAVVLAPDAVPARAAAYLVPAAALTWVWWRADVRGGPVVVLVSGIDILPTWVDILPWTVAALVETALVVILWVLAVRGLRVLLPRYRPPEALLTP